MSDQALSASDEAILEKHKIKSHVAMELNDCVSLLNQITEKMSNAHSSMLSLNDEQLKKRLYESFEGIATAKSKLKRITTDMFEGKLAPLKDSQQ